MPLLSSSLKHAITVGLLAFASSQTCAMVSRQMPFSPAFSAKTFIISYFLPKNALKIASKFQPFCYNCSKIIKIKGKK